MDTPCCSCKLNVLAPTAKPKAAAAAAASAGGAAGSNYAAAGGLGTEGTAAGQAAVVAGWRAAVALQPAGFPPAGQTAAAPPVAPPPLPAGLRSRSPQPDRPPAEEDRCCGMAALGALLEQTAVRDPMASGVVKDGFDMDMVLSEMTTDGVITFGSFSRAWHAGGFGRFEKREELLSTTFVKHLQEMAAEIQPFEIQPEHVAFTAKREHGRRSSGLRDKIFIS